MAKSFAKDLLVILTPIHQVVEAQAISVKTLNQARPLIRMSFRRQQPKNSRMRITIMDAEVLEMRFIQVTKRRLSTSMDFQSKSHRKVSRTKSSISSTSRRGWPS